jgi:hypothetical protein
MPGEPLRVDGCRGDDQEIASTRKQLLHITEQKIDVEAALVGFVGDERIVLPQLMSPCVSASRMPSVMILTYERCPTLSVKRIL